MTDQAPALAMQQPVTLPWSIDMIRTQWAVYEILTDETPDGKSIWVGCDKLSEMLQLNEIRKTPAFKSHVWNNPNSRIVVIGLFDEELTARRLQFEYRKLRKPIGNMQWSTVHNNRRNGTGRVVCVETGEEYRNSAEAARNAGVAASTMSNHILGRRGYARVNDLTYKRVKT